MLKTKRLLAAAVAMMIASGANAADVLESAPADSLVAIKVANLAKTSAKVAKLAKDFGVDGFAPPLQNPLAALKGRLQISKGLKEDGELCMAILKGEDGAREPGVIMLVPVTTFAEFVTNFKDAKIEGGVAEVQFAGDNDPSYVGDWGEYVAVSPTKNLVAAKPGATLKPAGVAAKEAAREDVLVYANFARITPEVEPQFNDLVGKMNTELEKGLQKNEIPVKWHALIKTGVGQAVNVVKSFLRDAESATFGLNITDAGVNATLISEFKQDTYLGKVVSGIKNTDAPLMVGLPAQKYLVFGGAISDPKATSQIIDDLTKPIVDELSKIEGQEKGQEAVKQLLAASKLNQGYVFGTPVPTKIGAEPLLQQVSVYRGAGKEMKLASDSTSAYAKSLLGEIKTTMVEKNPDAAKHLGDIIITPNARTVEGLAFDNFKLETPENKDNPGAAQAKMITDLFYGQEGLTYSYAALGDNFIIAQTATDETLAKFITAAKANEDNLSKLDHVKVVSAELPKQRLYEAYVAMDELVITGAAVAGTMGMNVPVQLPPELPPFGFSAGSEGTALRFDVHIPSATVQQLIAAGMQVFMQMQGGGGGGGGNL